jgi:DNA-binding FadR family transcriptional regulator
VRRVNAYEQIVAQVEEQVRTGELSPGDRLPSERRLMSSFEVSRSTVREAMRVMTATGLVESRPGDPRGPVVLDFSPQALRAPLERMVHQGASRVELLQFRLVIDGQAALMAAVRADSAAIDGIEDAARAIREQSQSAEISPAGFAAIIRTFHQRVRDAAHNRLIQVCGEAVTDALGVIMGQRLQGLSDPERRARVGRSADDAARLVGLIRSGDGAASQRCATANIYRYYRDSLEPAERELLEGMVEDPGA